MKVAAPFAELDYRWANLTAVSGLVGVVAYSIVLAAEEPGAYAVALTFAFAFGITVSSIGLYHVLGKVSPLGLMAAVANVTAGTLLLAMLMVQLSVKALVQQPDAAIKAVWLGLDVAWDLYLSAGTILFALCMVGRRSLGGSLGGSLGLWFAVPGLLIGGLLLVFNLATFPNPPAEVGLVDFGPLVGLWYMAVYVRVGASSLLQARRQRRTMALG